jgi:hypothetical protein
MKIENTMLKLLLLVSYLTIVTGTIVSQTSRWEIGAYTDQFGDRTGDFYLQYSTQVDALFTGNGYTNKKTTLRELSFSQTEGLSFYVVDTDLGSFSSTDALFNIKLPDGRTIEFSGKGLRNNRNHRFMFNVPYNDELLNTLLQENITVRFATNNRQCQFQFPQNFRRTYEEMKNRRTEIATNLPLRWSVGSFIDRWGDKTGDYFVKFDGEVPALRASSASRSEQTIIKELSFSIQQGLTFIISDIQTIGGVQGIGDVLFRIILPDETVIEFNGHGYNDRKILQIPYNDELLNLLLQENITINASILDSARRQYQFKLPSRFKEAYDLLKNR